MNNNLLGDFRILTSGSCELSQTRANLLHDIQIPLFFEKATAAVSVSKAVATEPITPLHGVSIVFIMCME